MVAARRSIALVAFALLTVAQAQTLEDQEVADRTDDDLLNEIDVPPEEEGFSEFTGYFEAQIRYFPETPLSPKQHNGPDLSLAAEPEYYYEWPSGEWSFTGKLFGRLDSQDPNRTHFDVREFNFLTFGDDWELLVGVGKVFWGVTESRHVVDIINQTDLVENPDEEEKLGQPMIKFDWIQDWGTLSFFYLPYFRERTFPGPQGRLRTIPYVDEHQSQYESSLAQWHPDLAIRWAHYFDDIDIGLYYFYGTSRDPVFTPGQRGGEPVLIPNYNLMHQVGLDLQYTVDAWLWKFEGIVRSGKGQHFQAFTGGFEYTFYGLFESDADLGTLVEYSYHSLQNQAVTPFENDIFAGLRLTLNDEWDTTILAGPVIDADSGSTSVRLEAERRLDDHWKLFFEAQTFNDIPANNQFASFRRDSFVSLSLRWYY
ncbi:MAG: hypothetical protein AAGA45_00730 [Verrucomicrobiota bacterium]